MDYQIFFLFPQGDHAEDNCKKLLDLLVQGWKITSSAGAESCIVYTLEKSKK